MLLKQVLPIMTFVALAANPQGLSAISQATSIVQNEPALESSNTGRISKSFNLAIGMDYTAPPAAIRENVNTMPGIFFLLGFSFKNFTYDVFASFAWPRTKGTFEYNGYLWPENSTASVIDMNGTFGYAFWLSPRLQLKPAIGIGNTQVGLWGKHDQIRYTTLNVPVALNLVYFLSHEGQVPTISEYSRLMYSLILRVSYAYWPNIPPGNLTENGVWHVTAGFCISLVKSQK